MVGMDNYVSKISLESSWSRVEDGLMKKNCTHRALEARVNCFLLDSQCSFLFQIELIHIFILSLSFVSLGVCPFFANLQRIKKEMSQALSVDPSALCKLEQRDRFSLIFFGEHSSGGEMGTGREECG